MLHGLHNAVFVPGGAVHTQAELEHGLVVAAVDHQLAAVKLIQHGVDCGLDGVGDRGSLRGLGVGAAEGFFQVLVDGAAQGDVHHLMAPADAQKGLALVDAAAYQGQLRLVPGLVDLHRTQVELLKFFGVHIAAAGQDQAVEVHLQVRAVEGQGFPAGAFHGGLVQAAALRRARD